MLFKKLIFVILSLSILSLGMILSGMILSFPALPNLKAQQVEPSDIHRKPPERTPAKAVPSSLRWLMVELAAYLSGKKDLSLSHQIFIQAENLKTLKLPKDKIEAIGSQMQGAFQDFKSKINGYKKSNSAQEHVLRTLDIHDIEFMPFAKDIHTIAVKNVVAYYIVLSKDFSQSRIIEVHIPAILLIDRKWYISELKAITISSP